MIAKVCGLTDPQQLLDIAGLGADWIGFIFYPLSARYVGRHTELIRWFSSEGGVKLRNVRKVGVCVDEPLINVFKHCLDFHLDMIQLHGNENPEYLDQLLAGLHERGFGQVRLIKAWGVDDTFDFERCRPFDGLVSFFLFDTRSVGHGGSGSQFPWHLLEAYNGRTPFILSGGIGPKDLDSLAALSHPRFAGVDVNSKFELSPGIKDIHSLRSFMTGFRQIAFNSNASLWSS